MNDEGRPLERPRQSSHVAAHVSSERGQAAVAELDARLELRSRLVAIVDALDTDDAVTASVNVRWLLEDLDRLAS